MAVNNKIDIPNQFNLKQYNGWYDEPSDLKQSSKDNYKSTIQRFLKYIDNKSILDINKNLVKDFLFAPSGIKYQSDLKPTTNKNRFNYLKNFLIYVYIKFPGKTNWDFTPDQIDSIAPSQNEINETKITATPITFKELILLYKKFAKSAPFRTLIPE